MFSRSLFGKKKTPAISNPSFPGIAMSEEPFPGVPHRTNQPPQMQPLPVPVANVAPPPANDPVVPAWRVERDRLKVGRDELRDWFKVQKQNPNYKQQRKEDAGYDALWKQKRQQQMDVGTQLVQHKEAHSKYQGGHMLRPFSGGAVNTPKLVNYGTGANPANKVFKQNYNVSDIPKAKQPNAPSMTGIDLQNSQISRRAVATSKMDKMLGTNVVPKTSFATHGGVSGSVMDQISGKEVKELATAGEVEALYKKPSIKRGMYNAQTLDYFTGEPDRHWANLMIDTARDEVQLHDNEFAQGVHTQPLDKQPASFKAARMNMDAVGSPALGSHRKGVPRKVDQPVLDRIRQPGFEEDVRAKLAGYVTEPELKGRFRAVKHGRHRLQQPDIKTVPDWQNEEEDESDYGYFYTNK